MYAQTGIAVLIYDDACMPKASCEVAIEKTLVAQYKLKNLHCHSQGPPSQYKTRRLVRLECLNDQAQHCLSSNLQEVRSFPSFV